MNKSKENNNSSIEEIKGEIKKGLNSLGNVITQFNQLASELKQRLVTVIEEALDDEQIKVSVGFEFWGSELIHEDVDFKIELWGDFGEGTPYINMKYLVKLTKTLNCENIKISAKDNHLVLYIGCWTLASCLGCDMSVWVNDDE